jgi:hypothetical protein
MYGKTEKKPKYNTAQRLPLKQRNKNENMPNYIKCIGR